MFILMLTGIVKGKWNTSEYKKELDLYLKNIK